MVLSIKKIFYIVSVFFFLVIPNLFSQHNIEFKDDYNLWLSIGVPGLIWGERAGGFGGSASIAYSRENSIYSIRYLGWINPNVLVPFSNKSNSVLGGSEFDLLYGKVFKINNYKLFFSSGLGLVTFKKDRYYGLSNINEIGIPFEFRTLVTRTAVIGVGLIISANLNRKYSFVGISFFGALGKMR